MTIEEISRLLPEFKITISETSAPGFVTGKFYRIETPRKMTFVSVDASQELLQEKVAWLRE